MTDKVVKTLTDPAFLIALLVGVAVFATVFTLLPAFGGNPLKARMKSRGARARRTARQAARAACRRGRSPPQGPARGTVDRHAQHRRAAGLRRALADEDTLHKLKVAGFRGQDPLTRFLFFRLVLPFVGFALALLYLFVLGEFARAAASHQVVRLHRRRLCRLLRADALCQQPRHQAQAVDPDGLAGRARSDADLRRIRHVGGGGVAQGRRRDRQHSRWSSPKSSC